MTRGKMILLGAKNKIYETVEFNGDMHLERHGNEIIQAFKDGCLQDVDAFCNYVTRFDKQNFHYAASGEILVRRIIGEKSGRFDVRENWTDYLYIVNESGKRYALLTRNGEMSLENSQMAVVYFTTLKEIKSREERQKEKATFLISKKEFVSILKRMKETSELVDDIDERLRKFKDGQIHEFCSGAGLVITNEEYVLRLLALLTEEKYGDIDYFVYELKYGDEYQEGCITREDGSLVDLSCAEKLYDYLEVQKNEEVRRKDQCD